MNLVFEINQRVRVLGIDVLGKIRAITLDLQGINYKVSFWYEGKYCEVWLPADELCGVKE